MLRDTLAHFPLLAKSQMRAGGCGSAARGFDGTNIEAFSSKTGVPGTVRISYAGDMQSDPRARTRLGIAVLRTLALGCLLAFCGASAPPASAQVSAAAPAAPAAQRPTSTPYTGDLSIFESKDRDKRLQINRVMDLLGISAGKTVADCGAGSGWFTVRAAARVGAAGTVYAEDINPEAIAYINRRAASEHLANVHTVLGSPDDPKLPAHSLDAVLLMKTYHEIAQPVAFLEALRPALKSGAKVGIIDRNGNGTDHGIMPAVILREAKQAGYRLTATYDFTKADGQDYFLILQAQ